MAISNYTATTTSGEAVAANEGRDQLIITNTGSNAVFLNIGGAAQVNKGIYLSGGGGTWVMDYYTYSHAKIEAITSSGTSNLSIYEG